MRRLVLMGVILAALVLAATAQGKGPSSATIDGPGADGGISIGGNGEPGSGAPLGSFAEHTGFFAATFQKSLTPSRPKGDLGPRYTITYVVPGPNGEEDTIRQDLYPYAAGGPVTYTAAGQSYFRTEGTQGGWHRASVGFKNMLVNAGLPATAPSGNSGDGGFGVTDLWPALGIAFGLGLVALMAVVMRRRPRTAAAG
jgi:hypothetical protein